MRAIDAEKAKFFIADVLDAFKVPVGDRMADRLIKTIDALPTVDAVEVVRCKDCDWHSEPKGVCTNPKCGKSWCGCPVPDEHYCSYGEWRRA